MRFTLSALGFLILFGFCKVSHARIVNMSDFCFHELCINSENSTEKAAIEAFGPARREVDSSDKRIYFCYFSDDPKFWVRLTFASQIYAARNSLPLLLEINISNKKKCNKEVRFLNKIRPKIGELYLGMSRDEFFRKMGKPNRSNVLNGAGINAKGAAGIENEITYAYDNGDYELGAVLVGVSNGKISSIFVTDSE